MRVGVQGATCRVRGASGSVQGAEATGAEAMGAEAMGAGAVGAEAMGAGAVGAEATGAGGTSAFSRYLASLNMRTSLANFVRRTIRKTRLTRPTSVPPELSERVSSP